VCLGSVHGGGGPLQAAWKVLPSRFPGRGHAPSARSAPIQLLWGYAMASKRDPHNGRPHGELLLLCNETLSSLCARLQPGTAAHLRSCTRPARPATASAGTQLQKKCCSWCSATLAGLGLDCMLSPFAFAPSDAYMQASTRLAFWLRARTLAAGVIYNPATSAARIGQDATIVDPCIVCTFS
jgi:hypothetical protein